MSWKHTMQTNAIVSWERSTLLITFTKKSILLSHNIKTWNFFLSFSLIHPSIHPFIQAVEIPQAIFGCIGPGFFSFGVYSCNETGYDLFLLRNQVHRCIHLSSLTYYSHLHSHVFFSSPQTVPPMHTLKDHFLSVCGLHPCCVTFVALWFLFNFSASLLCNSIFHHPYTFLPRPQLSCPFPCPSLYLLSSFIPALYFSHSRLTSIPLH